MRREPPALIYEAAELQRQRLAEERLRQLDDASMASGLKLGQKYIDPKNPSGQAKAGEPHYSLKPLTEHREALNRQAYPWLYTPEGIADRREREEQQMFDAMFKAAAGLSA